MFRIINQQRTTAVALTVVSLLLLVTVATASSPVSFLTKKVTKKQYTPLVFFTVPKDIIPECDEMEKVIKEVERELGVRVERLNILKEPGAEAILATLTKRSPPFLYHRESLQVVHVPGATSRKRKGNDEDDEEISSKRANAASKIDKERVRAWAKGRYLPALSASAKSLSGSTSGGKKPVVLSQEDNAIDQKELLDELYMSPSQKSGKEAIEKRTEEQAAKAKSKAASKQQRE